ncbi:MAG: transketolase [Myxococcota bacterium]|jgi:transketolase
MSHSNCANTIRGLAMDAVQAANSGHPGMPMGTADMATVLWTQFLKHDPTDPSWPDRDRFVLSAGHGSALLYSLLHLSGYPMSLDDLRDFRQWGSNTPGHPEVGHTVGVETTTGPLGQGFATGVGMALAERYLRETFGSDLCSHRVWGIVSDGDLMEGISAEASSIAGHLKLGHLNYLYDSNHITIDGGTDLSFTEDVEKRFEAVGWHVVSCDGHDPEALSQAMSQAQAETDRPTLVICRTVIGWGSTIEGTSQTHGAPLGDAEIAIVKAKIGLDPEQSFQVLDGVTDAFRAHKGAEARAAWEARLAASPKAEQFQQWLAGDTLAALEGADWPSYENGMSLATRKASQQALTAIVDAAPWVLGGSADLAGSNGTKVGGTALSPEAFAGARTVHFGVREHAMGAVCNGMALHGGLLPYGATFLVFHDYQRPAVRLAALMRQQVIYIYTHDSVFLGEDGPTHQPVEHLLAMRCIPNVTVYRPADARETAASWKAALANTTGPTCLVLTRQGLPVLPGTLDCEAAVEDGGYIVSDCDGEADVVLIGTGSEVATLVEASQHLQGTGIAARVVSLPCRERFLELPRSARSAVLPAGIPRVSLEAGTTMGWHRVVGDTGLTLGIDTFGHSSPANIIAEKLGFTGSHVAATVRDFLGRD